MSEHERLLSQVDDLLVEVVTPVIRAVVNGVDPTALAAAGTERVTDFIVDQIVGVLEDLQVDADKGIFYNVRTDEWLTLDKYLAQRIQSFTPPKDTTKAPQGDKENV